MAVAFDNQDSKNSGGSAVASLVSNSITIGSGANRACDVVMSFLQSTTPASLTVKLDNTTSMTAITGAVINDATSGITVIAFGLVNPPSGTHSWTAAWTGAVVASMGTRTVSGADQTGGTTTFKNGRSNSANGTAASTGAISSALGNLTVGTFVDDGGTSISTVTPGGETQAYLLNGGAGFTNIGGNYKAGAASNNMTATIAAIDVWDAVGFDYVAASTGDTFGNNMTILMMNRSKTGWRKIGPRPGRLLRPRRSLILPKRLAA